MTTDQVWVEIDDTVSIGIERDEAMSLDRNGFVELYKRTVYPPPGFRARRAWKRDAEAWADKQIADRGSAPDSEAATPRRPEDDALDRLTKNFTTADERLDGAEGVALLATVREALERQREERDAAQADHDLMAEVRQLRDDLDELQQINRDWFGLQERERRLTEGLREADEAVSAAHDILWASYDEWEGEHGRRDPLNTAMWRLHEIIRPLLGGATDDRNDEGIDREVEWLLDAFRVAPEHQRMLVRRALLSANPPQGDAAEGSSPSDGGGAK